MFVVRRNHLLTSAAVRAALGLALLLTARTVQATTLSDLLVPGATLHAGNVTFSDFTYLGTGQMPAPSSINVVPQSATNSLLFQGAFLDMPAGNGSDATFGFHVTADQGDSLFGAILSGNPAIIGQGTLTLTESFAELPTVLNIFASTSGPNHLIDQLSGLSSTTSLTVTGVLQAEATSGAATLSFFAPSFQVVTGSIPEPASLSLAAIALGTAGLVAGRKKWLRRQATTSDEKTI